MKPSVDDIGMPPAPVAPGVLFCLQLDGKGGATELGDGSIDAINKAWHAASADRPVWIHVDRNHPDAKAWLSGASGLDDSIVRSLMQEEPRPRLSPSSHGTTAVFRGVNLNDTDEDPMLAVRLCATEHRLVSVRVWRVMSIRDVRAHLNDGRGPSTTAGIVSAIAVGMGERTGAEVARIEAEADELEIAMSTLATADARSRIAALRRQAIQVRRYIAPQQDVVAKLARGGLPGLDSDARDALTDMADRLQRDVDALDATREHLGVAHDELSNTLAERMNRISYALTIVASLFLPLGFITGLLGINVGGMPLAQNTAGFWLVSAGCVLLLAIQAVVLWFWLGRR
ncbi:MAG: CorA family divalent cation transporter [Planctomycetota bacterium]